MEYVIVLEYARVMVDQDLVNHTMVMELK